MLEACATRGIATLRVKKKKGSYLREMKRGMDVADNHGRHPVAQDPICASIIPPSGRMGKNF
jgi:hypothetical protein